MPKVPAVEMLKGLMENNRMLKHIAPQSVISDINLAQEKGFSATKIGHLELSL